MPMAAGMAPPANNHNHAVTPSSGMSPRLHTAIRQEEREHAHEEPPILESFDTGASPPSEDHRHDRREDKGGNHDEPCITRDHGGDISQPWDR